MQNPKSTLRVTCAGLTVLVWAFILQTGKIVADGEKGESKPAAEEKDRSAQDAPSEQKKDAANTKDADANEKSQTENKPAPSKNTPKKTDDKPADGDSRESDATPENPFPNRVKTPDGILDGGSEWLNTSGPITLPDLRGKIVLFDFWTYCCINCMHVLPDLKFLEQKYANELVVIGVHSAKFKNEKDSENIRQAIMRYEIEHPVVNDSEMIIWRKFGTRSWPTLALVDPEGHYVGSQSGEGNRELFDMVIGKLIAYHRAKGTLDETPISFRLEREKQQPTPLRFPGKVLADEASNRLFISDSNNNRIVVTSLQGELQEVIGSGMIGRRDGTYAEALFDHPQGMTLDGDILYVADTENHCIRAVNLAEKKVSTVAGTGDQSRVRVSGGPVDATPLNSPWALMSLDGGLYIAMAGPHQIWFHQPGSDSIDVYAGTGREDVINGPRSESAWAQPSGITTDGRYLYIVDSEGSSVRKLDTEADGEVTTLAGTSDLPGGRSLFEFGDIDGTGGEARLQHPLGIVWHDGELFVADSYNHKIKRIDANTGKTKTWLGDGTAGDQLDPPRFSEPAGLSIAGGTLYVADTNNHRICTIDIKSGAVKVLNIKGLGPPKSTRPARQSGGSGRKAEQLSEQVVACEKTLDFEVALSIPDGYKLNKLAPVIWKLSAADPQTLVDEEHLDARSEAKTTESTALVSIPVTARTGSARFELSVTWGYCRDGTGGLCKVKTARWLIPIKAVEGADASKVVLKTE